jgi:FKBP-type peptidyl-prolyl cis-trans isomerase (trigger factor)
MQVTELANDGLKRAYSVTVSAGDIAATREKRLAEIARTVTLPGFRPGKVPLSVVKRRYGAAVLGEVLEQSVTEASRQVVTDRGLKPALQPKIEVTSFAEDGDLQFRMDLEVLPEVPMPDFSAIALERLKAEPTEEAVQRALASIAERNGTLEDAEPGPAGKGDVLVCDFTGRLPPDLLANGPALGAVPGRPGTAPQGWSIALPAGLEQEIAAVGSERGLPYVDLALRGTAEAGVIRISPGAVAAKPGQAITLEARLRVVAGALPTGAAARLVLGAARAEATLGEAPMRAVLTAEAENPEAAIEIAVPAGALEATLRIGPARAFAGAEEPEARAFAGGAATDMAIEVGGEGFIPGFTEQLEGLAPGESRDIEVVFPADYGSAELAGKRARFTVVAKARKTRKPRAVDDDLAKTLGMEDLGKLREAIRASLQREYDALSRMRLKRALLDALAEKASFPVPEGMVEAEFAQIWQRVEADLKAGRLDAEDQGKDEATLKAEYRAIAERRIRLGLLLSEIGRANNVQVSQDEMARALRQEAMRYPGQEAKVLEFFQKNPQAAESLRAPLFEEKVVDFVIELAKVTERQVSPEELASTAA